MISKPTTTTTVPPNPTHELLKRAFGNITPLTSNLTHPNFRALDINTGDGSWLHDLRSQLQHPEEADLVGTDFEILPAEQRPFSIPRNMRFLMMMPTMTQRCSSSCSSSRRKNEYGEDGEDGEEEDNEWPEDLHGYFDLVRDRTVVEGSRGDWERAVEGTGRLLRLVKPGGGILLVGCCLEGNGNDDDDGMDAASRRLFKLLGNGFSSGGGHGSLGGDLAAVLNVASHRSGVRLVDVRVKKAVSRIGEGAEVHMRELGMAWLEQLKGACGASRSKADLDHFDHVVSEAVEEADTKGFDITWYASWATRSDGNAGGAIELPG